MLRVVDSFDDAVELLDWVTRQPFVAVDTETTDFRIYSPGFAVRLIQFGNMNEAWVMSLAPWVGIAQEAINRCRQIVFHNSRFDIEALAQHGIVVPWSKVDDTMIALRLSEPHRPAALKDASRRLIAKTAGDGQAALHKAMKRNKWDWATIPIDFPDYVHYAALDVILTSRLYNNHVVRAGLNSPIYPMEMAVRQVCTTMERNGMRIDVPLCEEESAVFTKEIDELKTAFGDKGVNLTSNAELARWLLSHGAKITHVTDSGAPAVTRDSLLEARLTSPAETQEVIDAAIRVRKLQKLVSTYLNNFISMNVDGLLHSSIETIAARTGRSSIREPALQTLPRGDDADAARIRATVIPRNEGEVLISSDFDQIELRLIANFSGDKALQEAFLKSDASGLDFFTQTTRDVFGDQSITKSDPRRTMSKTLWYASSFGAGITKMAATAKVPVDEMRTTSEAVFKKYPGARALVKTCEREAAENSNFITTPMGRRIYVDPEFGYKALNAKIQATAGDVFKLAMVDLAHAGLDEWAVLPIHDEVLFSIPKDCVEDASVVIKQVMCDMDWPVPLTAGPSGGAERWSLVEK